MTDQRPFERRAAPMPVDLDEARPLAKAAELPVGHGVSSQDRPRFSLDSTRLLNDAKKGAIDCVVDAKSAIRQWTFDEMIREVEQMRKHLPKVDDAMSAQGVMAVVEHTLPFMLNNWARGTAPIDVAEPQDQASGGGSAVNPLPPAEEF